MRIYIMSNLSDFMFTLRIMHIVEYDIFVMYGLAKITGARGLARERRVLKAFPQKIIDLWILCIGKFLFCFTITGITVSATCIEL